MYKIRFAVIPALLAAWFGIASAAPNPPKSLRVYVLDCGVLDIPDTSPYRLKKEELATTKMSAPCFLVVHPKGTMMWDTGPVPDGQPTHALRHRYKVDRLPAG